MYILIKHLCIAATYLTLPIAKTFYFVYMLPLPKFSFDLRYSVSLNSLFISFSISTNGLST